MKTYQEYYDYHKDTGMPFLSEDTWNKLPIKPKKAVMHRDNSLTKSEFILNNCTIEAKDGDVIYKWNDSFIQVNLQGYAVIPADKYYGLLRQAGYRNGLRLSFLDKVKQFFNRRFR